MRHACIISSKIPPTLSNMTAVTEVPDLSHADIQFIFEVMDTFFNGCVMDAFCKGVNTHSCNFSQFIPT